MCKEMKKKKLWRFGRNKSSPTVSPSPIVNTRGIYTPPKSPDSLADLTQEEEDIIVNDILSDETIIPIPFKPSNKENLCNGVNHNSKLTKTDGYRRATVTEVKVGCGCTNKTEPLTDKPVKNSPLTKEKTKKDDFRPDYGRPLSEVAIPIREPELLKASRPKRQTVHGNAPEIKDLLQVKQNHLEVDHHEGHVPKRRATSEYSKKYLMMRSQQVSNLGSHLHPY